MNFIGVIVRGIAVAYALVELIPAEVLSPPDGEIAAGMLTALFTSALLWNVGTWWLGIPNSSSHALIGSHRSRNRDSADAWSWIKGWRGLAAGLECSRFAPAVAFARVRSGVPPV
jgi:hypothetical protein